MNKTLYDNTSASVTLFRARTSTLLLGIKRKHQGGDIICELCKNKTENLQHFLLRYTTLSETRKHIIILQQPYKGDQEETIANFLFFSSFFFFSKKLTIVVVRDVCPSVRPSVRLSVYPSVRLWK